MRPSRPWASCFPPRSPASPSGALCACMSVDPQLTSPHSATACPLHLAFPPTPPSPTSSSLHGPGLPRGTQSQEEAHPAPEMWAEDLHGPGCTAVKQKGRWGLQTGKLPWSGRTFSLQGQGTQQEEDPRGAAKVRARAGLGSSPAAPYHAV